MKNTIRSTTFCYKLSFSVLFILSFFISKSFAQGDDCFNALTLTNLSNYCSPDSAYTTIGSTNSSNPKPTCWASSTNDVWFKFTAVGTDINITINGNTVNANGTLTNPNVALYSGNCNALSEISCAVTGLTLNAVTFYNSTIAIGNTYYIRVNGSNLGLFQLCINNFIANPNNNQDCATAAVLCSKDPLSSNSFNGPGNNQNEVAGSCIPFESQSTWYRWTAANNGTLTISILPNNQTDDIDFFVFEMVGNDCNNKNIIRCCSSSCLGPGGLTGLSLTETDLIENPGCFGTDNGSVKYIDMTTGTTYGILINNFSGQGGYNLSFGGTGEFQGPISDFTISDTLVCGLGTPVTFTNASTGFNRLKWFFGNAASIDTTSSQLPQTISFNAPGTYTIALEVWSSTGCDVINYHTVTVLPAPVLNLGNDTIICPNASLTLNAGNANKGFTYAWTPGGQTTQTITANAAGTYKATVSNACFSISDSITISYLSPPNVVLVADSMLCVGDSTIIDAGNYNNNYTTYLWSPDGQTSEKITTSTAGTYSASVSFKGCVTGTDSIHISIEDCEIEIPNVFTPNGDNVNDMFTIKGLDKHPNSILTIYNRWGNKVFESKNYLNNWNGSKESDGVYFYILKVAPGSIGGANTSNEYSTKSGFVTIIK